MSTQKPPRQRAERGTTQRAPPLTLKHETLQRLQQLADIMATAGMDRPNLSGAADLAILEPDKARELLATRKAS